MYNPIGTGLPTLKRCYYAVLKMETSIISIWGSVRSAALPLVLLLALMSLLSSLWFSPFSIYALALPLVSAAFIVIGFILALGAARQSRPSVFEARIGGPFRGQVVQLKGAGLPVVVQ